MFSNNRVGQCQFLPLNLKSESAAIHIDLSIEYCKLQSKLRHYFCGKKTIFPTKDKLDNHCVDPTPSISMEKKWFTEFCGGRISTNVAESCERYGEGSSDIESAPF